MIYRRMIFPRTAKIIYALSAFCMTLAAVEMSAGTAVIDVTNTLQTIDGFGFSSAWCGTLSAAKNNALYNTLGMSLLRVRIDENNNWAQETANSAAAHAYGAKVFGCPWRAPVYMTYTVTNGANVSIYLSTNYYNAFALWLNQAATSMNLDYVSIKNEPDMPYSVDLNMTPDQIRTFCANNAPSIGRPVTMADAVGFNDSVTDPTLNDPVADSHVAIVSGHFYGGGNYVHTNALAHGKRVWMTEHYLDNARNSFSVCMNMAKEISDAMNNKFSAYVWWWVADFDTNMNLVLSDGTIFKDGYILGQFAKFIRPNAVRITTYNHTASIYVTAYQNTNGQLIIVAINMSTAAVNQQFTIQNGTVTSMTPYQTTTNESMTALDAIFLTNGSFTTLLPAQSITTFVQNISLGSLVHRYNFGESSGSTVADSVGGPVWTGTLPGGGTLSGGQLTLASASQQYVSLPAGVVGPLSNITVMAWVKLNSLSTWSRIFDFGNNTTTYMFLTPQCGGSGTLRFAITTNSAGGEQQINCSSTLSTGAWHQAVVTLSSGSGVLYLDGVAVGTNNSMTLNPASLGTTVNNYIGKSQWADPYMDGQIDEFRIYDTGLSAAEIAATAVLGPNQQLSTNDPPMSAAITESNLNLTWPLANAGFTLQSCTNLALGNWMNVNTPMPQIVGDQWQVTIPASSTNSPIFYRLLK